MIVAFLTGIYYLFQSAVPEPVTIQLKRTNMKTKTTLLLALLLCSFTFISCNKNDMVTPAASQEAVLKLEPVDLALLQQYFDYQSGIERDRLNGSVKNSQKTLKQIQPLIDNFLASERNGIRKAQFQNHGRYLNEGAAPPDPNEKCYDLETGAIIECPPGGDNSGSGGGSGGGEGNVTCKGNFNSYNTVSVVVFTAKMNMSGSEIVDNGFGFGGISGTFTKVGPISQKYYDGVVTYQQIYSESGFTENGISYTQLYIMYGNVVKGSTCTVHGDKINPN